MSPQTLPHRQALFLVLLVAGCNTRDSASLPAAPVSVSSTAPPASAPAPDALPSPAASAAPPERPDFRVVLEVPPGLKKVREGRLARGRAETYTSSGTAALAVRWGWRSPDDPSLEAEWKSAIEAPPGSSVTFKKKGTT